MGRPLGKIMFVKRRKIIMFYGFTIHWLVVPIMIAISLIALWACHRTIGKLGLYFFNILALAVCNFLPSFEMFGVTPSIGVAFVLFAYISLLICFKKYGEKEATKLLMASLVVLVSTFAIKFVLAIVMSAGGEMFLNWQNFGGNIASVLAFTLATLVGYLFVKKNAQITCFKSALMFFTVAVCDALIYTIVSQAFLSVPLKSFLIELAIKCALVLMVSAFVPMYIKLFEDKVESEAENTEPAQEEVKEETPPAQEQESKEENKEAAPAEKPKKTSSKKTAEKPATKEPAVKKTSPAAKPKAQTSKKPATKTAKTAAKSK